jgi:Flp pilus assembly pilin Flp
MQFLTFALTWLLVRIRSERGQDLIEYALLGGLIAAALVAVIATGVLTNPDTGFMRQMVDGIGHCIDFKSSTTCGPF